MAVARVDGRSGAVASRLLWLAGLAAVGVLATCLPPDFVIAPEDNLPVSIDIENISGIQPGAQYQLQGCEPLFLDPRAAVVNPDGDTIFSYWLVNANDSPLSRPDQDDTRTTAPFAEQFEFDPCTLTDRREAPDDNVVVLVVRDRAPEDESTAEGVVDPGDTGATIDFVIWNIQVEPIDQCCEDRDEL